jgi:transposase-like protein
VAQHFLLSSNALTLSLASVLRLTDRQAEQKFASIRWASTDGKPVCPTCGGLDAYEARRPNGSLRFRCKACKGDFSLTSGTLFAFHKLPLQTYLAAIAIFCNEVKGKSALALSRDLGVQYKTAFVLAHKLREAVASEMKGKNVGGEGKIAEVDGGYFGGYVKPSNNVENRRDRRLAINQNGKRKVVVVIRERDGRTLTQTFPTEGASVSFIKSRVAKGTELMADEAGSWNDLNASFAMKRIDHGFAYSSEGACTNGAENFSTGCAALKSAISIISLARISVATLPRQRGVTITAARPTARSSARLSGWSPKTSRAPISAGIGSVTKRREWFSTRYLLHAQILEVKEGDRNGRE